MQHRKAVGILILAAALVAAGQAAAQFNPPRIVYKINTAEGSLGLFVNDTALYSEFTNLMARVNNLVADIERNPRKYLKFSVF